MLDNVTTVLLIAPVTFLVCDRLGLRPVPFLIAEVMASNIGGAATLVGDPPNIIIASRGDLTFNDFLVHMAPWIVVLMVVFCLMCRWLFRSAFVYDPERAEAVMSLQRARGDQGQAAPGQVAGRSWPWWWRRSCCIRCCTTSPRSWRSSAPACSS